MQDKKAKPKKKKHQPRNSTKIVNEAVAAVPFKDYGTNIEPAKIEMLKRMCALKMPDEKKAALLGMSLSMYRELIIKHDDLRQDLETISTISSAEFYRTIYDMAVKDKNMQAITLWARTREDFTYKHKVELTGADGGPIRSEVSTISEEELAAKMQQYGIVPTNE
jgi:hypothetical protein